MTIYSYKIVFYIIAWSHVEAGAYSFEWPRTYLKKNHDNTEPKDRLGGGEIVDYFNYTRTLGKK